MSQENLRRQRKTVDNCCAYHELKQKKYSKVISLSNNTAVQQPTGTALICIRSSHLNSQKKKELLKNTKSGRIFRYKFDLARTCKQLVHVSS